MISRRKFVGSFGKGLAAGAAVSAFASTAKSYAQILGANDRLNFAINGLNGRGHAHLASLGANSKTAAKRTARNLFIVVECRSAYVFGLEE